MSFDFSFRFAEDEKDIEGVVKFIEKQPLNYPNYLDWVYKTKGELLRGWKKSILAFSEGVLVGNLVFQPHKDFPDNFLELKNMRVHKKFQGRYFGVFMLKQAEVEAKGKYGGIICDTRSTNYPIINLLEFMKYKELFRAPLYDKNIEDVIFVKSFIKLRS